MSTTLSAAPQVLPAPPAGRGAPGLAVLALPPAQRTLAGYLLREGPTLTFDTEEPLVDRLRSMRGTGIGCAVVASRNARYVRSLVRALAGPVLVLPPHAAPAGGPAVMAADTAAGMAPVAARMLATGETARLQRVLRTGATFAALASAVLLLPMLVLPGPVLGVVFGSGFEAAATVLFLLTLGNAVNVLTGLCGTALTMSHREGVVAAVMATGVVLRILVGGAAAYAFGLTGLAATATVITAATYATLWFCARRMLSLWTHPTLRPSLGVLRRTKG